jgi:hypothetical protein
MAAVINRALEDLWGHYKARPIETDRAMAFILGDDCEAYCLALDVDYPAIQKQAAALYREFIVREESKKGRKTAPRKARHTSLPPVRMKPRSGSYR